MLSKKVFNFITSLEKNNNREWFNDNKDLYKEVKNGFENFVYEVASRISIFEPRITPEKKHFKFFRIYRDARFSKNKDPYKTNLGAAINYNGMKSGNAGYYIHIESNNSGLAGGKYLMDTTDLKNTREYISENHTSLQRILENENFKKYFKSFGDDETALKTVPRGFDKDDPAKEYIKHKTFTVWHGISDSSLLKEDSIDYIEDVFREINKLNNFLNRKN
ncbi:MAG: DUF2461 domain-containing protein [Candidatus Dojkabacteria bacterium]|nr:DUF2461 domain-containing protein [Candidatus Dojkabacteria bacterium]